MFHLSRHLAKRGVEVHVLTTKGNEASGDPSIKVHPIMRNWSWLELPVLAMFLKRCRSDGIMLKYTEHLYNGHPMITFAPTLSKALLPHTPFVTQFGIPDGSVPHEKSLLVRGVRKAVVRIVGEENVGWGLGTLLRDSDHIIVLAELHREELIGHFVGVERKSTLIPPPPIMYISTERNGASRRRGRELLRLGSEDFILAYFGYMYPSKGVETLLRAFQLARRNRSNLRLILIGGLTIEKRPSPYSREMFELSQQLGIETDVIWTGEYRSDSDEASLYLRASDACVLPFDQGIALHRSSFAGAAAHGLPIITTKGKSLESPFVDGKNVLLCEPKDPEGLAAAIESVIRFPELRQRLSEGAIELVEEWFSWEKAVDRTLEVFKLNGVELGA